MESGVKLLGIQTAEYRVPNERLNGGVDDGDPVH